MAIFLECAGVVPEVRGATYCEYCDALKEQYCRLELDVRRDARVEGRRRIRENGLALAALRLIPVPTPVCDFTKLSPKQRRGLRMEYLALRS